MVEVEVGDGAVKHEAAGFEVPVGDAVARIRRRRLSGDGDGDVTRMGGDGVSETKGGEGERGGGDGRK